MKLVILALLVVSASFAALDEIKSTEQMCEKSCCSTYGGEYRESLKFCEYDTQAGGDCVWQCFESGIVAAHSEGGGSGKSVDTILDEHLSCEDKCSGEGDSLIMCYNKCYDESFSKAYTGASGTSASCCGAGFLLLGIVGMALIRK
jgi:hypothetical protein